MTSETYDYHVEIKTGDRAGAGTDSNIYLRLFGTKKSQTEFM